MGDEHSEAAPRPSEQELHGVADPAGFGVALRHMRESRRLTLRGMERHLRELADRPHDGWSKSKIEQAEKGRQLEERWVLRYLSACDVPGPELAPWVMALRRAVGAQRVPATTEPSSAHPGGPGPSVSNLGPRNRVFTGRTRVLESLHALLGADDVAVIGTATDHAAKESGSAVGAEALHGLGGVGKTETVLEYAHRYRADYELIWWIPAEQPSVAAATIAALAGPLGVPEAFDQAGTIAAVFAHLRERRRWLLIYDNAEHPDALAGLLPTGGHGHVLVTSRWPAWSEVAGSLRLDVFDRAESLHYLADRTGDAEPASMAVLDELSELLGDLPLALCEAAAYLEHTGVGAGAYLELLRGRAADLFGLDPATSPASVYGRDAQRVATVWSVSLEQVRAQAPPAEALLTLFAFLGPDDIPRDLVPAHPRALSEELAAVAGDPLCFNRALAELGHYSMITLSPEAIGVHRLVQAVVRARLDPAAAARWTAAATTLLWAAFPRGDDAVDPVAWPDCARLLPHLLAVAEHARTHGARPAVLGALLDAASKYLRQRGEYARALPLARRALADTTDACGPLHADVADRHAELGRVLEELGELTEAREEAEEALRIGLAGLGPDHPDTGRWHNTLGRVLWRLGEAEAARRELEEALRVGVAVLGPEHPAVGRWRSSFGRVLWELGEAEAARRELEEALRVALAVLGPEHPAVGRRRSNLGGVLGELGEPTARRECEEALRVGVTALGSEHPDVARWRSNLAAVLRDLGEQAAAQREYGEALQVTVAALGPDHPSTRQVRAVLADMGR